MISYKSFYKFLLDSRLITPIWEYILEIIENEIIDNKDKEYYLVIFTMYFSLINDGNLCISLDKDELTKKWITKYEANKVLLENNEDFNQLGYEQNKIVALECINKVLDKINPSNLPELIGEDKIFLVDDNWLYLRKYYTARMGIIESLDRLFSSKRDIKNIDSTEILKAYKYPLSAGQTRAVNEGVNKNLIVTGGPGTGKTTSILFLLLNILKNFKDKSVYLIAPSGKAANRMKESITRCLNDFSEEYKINNKDVIDKINSIKESTIHSLLGTDFETHGFNYNKYHQFESNSLFVIDESSMIDVCLFNSLLQSIPTSAHVYILGDKNQLPSVESGAVFGELLKKESIKDNVIELDESIRFKSDTKIYDLARKINNGLEIPKDEIIWRDYEDFKIEDYDKTKPVFYYENQKEGHKELDIIQSIVKKWGTQYYKKLQDMATDLDPNDYESLDKLFAYSETSKILCAENKGDRGITNINKYVKKLFIDKTIPTSVYGYYPGMIMMGNKNNKMLDLYNGDSGILVTFKDDPTLYLMLKKDSTIATDGKSYDKIFKIKDYVFYPFRLFSSNEIDMAYAITIHKSQGSDYENILVILPNKKGHPLLNRQIIYTAITRTKGNTYILSNYDRLIEAKDTLIVRDTNIK